ncbi:MAG: BREX-1 system adenine-specific DNA-methyltransferase PglX, partial [Candidatus Dadabacteria bacterium]|nr:BREX-1 system adenine-specific DNA-methyltransferase PglX [Candidatus Dadabacteria bacterium]
VTVKPDARNPHKGLKLDLMWDQYISQFENLWLLSRESIVNGELDKLLLVKPKERLPVDKAILDDLKGWREILAKDIFKNNHNLFRSRDREKDANYLKEITQRILDRIIFMRSCEDRGLIHRRPLKELFEERTETVGTNTMIFLKDEFRNYNIIFDSDLFRPQEWEDNLDIDFKAMRGIVFETYNPYQFDVIPLEVLGNIYEQYLGYTIRLTDHQVKYELKPEVRKAGGVYYTPEYIVDYIVKNTVGKLLQEFPPNKIKKLRILDPACGSGSFLIRAYEEMLNYYRSQKKLQKKSTKGQETLDLKQEEGEPRLTIHEKSTILQEHIFGVDIDEQAVEVTKLSLMLKMLGDEYGIVPGRAILPMLDKNIKCGNSLISGDTLELKKYFGDDWYKVKPFNWDEEYRKIMKEEGGFDVVIGNPPYVRQEMLGDFKEYFKENYKVFHGIADLYVYFIEKGVSLLKEKGLFGFIVANKWMRANYGNTLRSWMKQQYIKEIIDFGDLPVFQEATTYPCILILSKERSKATFPSTKVEDLNFINLSEYVQLNHYQVNQQSLDDKGWSLVDESTEQLVRKLLTSGTKLGNYVSGKIYYGIKTGLNKAFVIDEEMKKRLIEEDHKSVEIIKTFLVGRDIKRYQPVLNKHHLIFTRRGIKIDNYPGIKKYLQQFKEELMPKPTSWKGKEWKGRKPGSYQWYEIQDTVDYYAEFERQKIIYPNICKKPEFTFDQNNFYTNQKCFIIPLSDKYLLGILNSSLNFFLFRIILPKLRGGFYEPSYVFFKDFPIRTINFSDRNEKKLHNDLVELVEVMLNLHKKIQIAKGGEKEQIQRQIEKTDREIDEIVYKLYGITEEEKKIIEAER